MRFDETNPKYRFDQQQTMSQDEKDRMISDYKEDLRVQLNESWGKLKDFTKGDDDRYLYEAGVKQRDESGKKGSKFPLIVFVVGVLAVVITAAMGFTMGIIGSFFGIILVLGIYSFRNANNIESETLVQQKKAGPILMIALGLAGVIPFFLSFFIDTGYAVAVMGILLFAAVGIYCGYSAVWKLFAKKIKYKESVVGTCIGYARFVDSHTSSSEHHHRTTYYVNVSPVFEYYYGGRQYKACYDVFDMRPSSDITYGSSNELFIDPKDPESVYHETKRGVIGSFLIGLVCVAIAAGLGFAVATGHVGDIGAGEESSSSSNSGGIPIIQIFRALKMAKGGDIKDKEIDRAAPKGEEWYCEEVAVRETQYESGDPVAYIYLDDEDFKTVVITDTDTYNPCGKKPICFYTVDDDALESGEAYKDVFMYRDSRTFTYVGDHEAYED